ncbi:MAG: hypothetical protein ACI4N1_13720 [Stenotrophomonas koreensis]
MDFDDLFDPYVEGTKPPATGICVQGVDLNQRYAPLSYGTKRADVGRRTGGVDVSNLWAAKGTAVYDRIQVPSLDVSSLTGPPVGTAHCAVNFYADGTVDGRHNSPQATVTPKGRWLLQGNAANYEIRFSHVSGIPVPAADGIWRSLASGQGFGIDSTAKSATAVVKAEIRRIGSGTPYASNTGTWTLNYGESGVIS